MLNPSTCNRRATANIEATGTSILTLLAPTTPQSLETQSPQTSSQAQSQTPQIDLLDSLAADERSAIKLRSYQQKLIKDIFDHWAAGVKSVLAQAPTGSGKRIIFCYIAKDFVGRGERVLVIAHKIELITQAVEDLERFTGLKIGVVKHGVKPAPECLIQVASIQSLVNREFPKASLVVVDEAHHCAAPSYSRVLNHYRQAGACILGLTATPMRIDGRGLRFLHGGVPGFQSLVLGPSVKQLIKDGHLCEFKIFASRIQLDPEAAGIRTQNGDYAQSELEEHAEKILLRGEVVDTWEKHAKGKRTVLYPVSVALSKQYCEEFKSRNIAAAHIDATTPVGERAQIIEQFRRGEILVLCQHSIIVEGVDVPAIECVQFARPTKSLTIWFQAIGRALRPAPGKPSALVIDHATTHQNLPWVDETIEWSLDPISLPDGTRHALKCPQPECGHVFRPTPDEVRKLWTSCPNCQTKFRFEVGSGERKGCSKVVEILPADFEELRAAPLNPEVMATLEHLWELYQERNYKPSWVYYRLVEAHPDIGLLELKALAERLNFKSGWAWHKWCELQARSGGAAA
jgi:superfamily II DNA or RNA helicase